jgi:hypothetical protein
MWRFNIRGIIPIRIAHSQNNPYLAKGAIAASTVTILFIGAYFITQQAPSQQLTQIQPEQREPANPECKLQKQVTTAIC